MPIRSLVLLLVTPCREGAYACCLLAVELIRLAALSGAAGPARPLSCVPEPRWAQVARLARKLPAGDLGAMAAALGAPRAPSALAAELDTDDLT
jgi:hypothetical protein